MKRGEKILLAIGTLWTVGLLSVQLYFIPHGPMRDSQKEGVFLTAVIILVIWTVLGLIWIFVYGRRE